MLNPETEIIESSIDGEHCFFVVERHGRRIEFSVLRAELNRAPAGPVGIPQRRATLARAFQEAYERV